MNKLILRENLKEEMRLRVLRLIEAEPALSQREIAARLGVSLGSVNFCLKALISKGWIKVNNFRRSDNKLGYAYMLTPSGASGRMLATKRFLHRKILEYEDLKEEIATLQETLGEKETSRVRSEFSGTGD